jgi:hypothetical protein
MCSQVAVSCFIHLKYGRQLQRTINFGLGFTITIFIKSLKLNAILVLQGLSSIESFVEEGITFTKIPYVLQHQSE